MKEFVSEKFCQKRKFEMPGPFALIPELQHYFPQRINFQNVINLSDSAGEVENKIKKAYSGDGHALFTYGKLFGVERNDRMSSFKPALADAINHFLEPIRERRAMYENERDYLRQTLDRGRERVRTIGSNTLNQVKEQMEIKYI